MNWDYGIRETSQLSLEKVKVFRDKLYEALSDALKDTEYFVRCAVGTNKSRTYTEIDMHYKEDYSKKSKHKVCEIFIVRDSNKHKYDFPLSICTNDLVSMIDYYFTTTDTEYSREDHTSDNWSQKIRYFMSFKDLNEIIKILGGKAFISSNSEDEFSSNVSGPTMDKTETEDEELPFGERVEERKRGVPVLDEEVNKNAEAFFRKYSVLLKLLYEDTELRSWCANYSIYKQTKEHKGLENIIYDSFMREAYDSGIIIKNYLEIIRNAGIDERLISNPTRGWLANLSKMEILVCITNLFRLDHFDNGHLINYSLADGVMLRYFNEYLKK